jgi:hypothetical protein
MALFGKRNKQLNTMAPLSLPDPGPTTIHNHSTPWVGIIVVAFFCLVISFPVLWWMLVFLADKAGYRDPEAAVAWWLLFAPMVAGLVAIARLAFLDIALAAWDKWLAFRLEVEQEVSRREHDKLLTAGASIASGRMTDADYEFARVVLAVMTRAYDQMAQRGGAPFRGQGRPWSQSQSLSTAEEIKAKISGDKALEVGRWLERHGVITQAERGQIITRNYPDIAAVKRVLDREYDKPIRVNNPPISGGSNWSIIEP